MSRFPAFLAAAVVAAVPSAVLVPAAPAASVVLQRVTAHDLEPLGPWVRLQDDRSNAGRPAGVQEVAPFADPVRFNGSLHLAVAPDSQAQQAQAAHYFNRKTALSTVAASPLSYDMYVRAWTSTPGAVPYGANLQLPVYCQGVFTTLSFLPQLATDGQGRTGPVADAWRHFASTASSRWSTSQAVASFGANTDHPLSDYVSACNAAGDGAVGVIANVGRLGSPTDRLDTYVDNITVNGAVYDFTTGKTAAGRIVLAGASPDSSDAGPLGGVIAFDSPRNGPDYSSVGVRLDFSRPGGLLPGAFTVTAYGRPVTLAAGPNGTLTAVVTPPADVDLGAGGSYLTPFTVTPGSARTASDWLPGDALSLGAELLAQGYEPLQPTGVAARGVF